jgi:hypothetical protein
MLVGFRARPRVLEGQQLSPSLPCCNSSYLVSEKLDDLTHLAVRRNGLKSV